MLEFVLLIGLTSPAMFVQLVRSTMLLGQIFRAHALWYRGCTLLVQVKVAGVKASQSLTLTLTLTLSIARNTVLRVCCG